MKQITITSGDGGNVQFTGYVMAMFSPQPVRVVYNSDRDITLEIWKGGRFITSETRKSIKQGAQWVTEFEVSRLLQIACDVEHALEKLRYGDDREGHDVYLADMAEEIIITIADDREQLIDIDVEALYAAVDTLEEISDKPVTLRAYPYFPQTFPVGLTQDDTVTVSDNIEGDSFSLPWSGASYMIQWAILPSAWEDTSINEHLRAGEQITLRTSWLTYIKDGQQATSGSLLRKMTLIPDTTPFGKGIYLRWLHRDGSVGYWLFGKSKKTFAAASRMSYKGHISGVEAAPENGVYRNRAHGDFKIGETLTIGTSFVTDSEYEYLCGLVSSPIVDMLVGGDVYEPVWQRVNVAPGSYTREYPRSGLGRLKDFELAITLPEKNTITL